MRPETRLPDDAAADPADAAEQDRTADPAHDERLPEDLPTGADADPADVLDQYRDAPQDDDEER